MSDNSKIYSRKNTLGYIDYYDEHGKKIGSSRESASGRTNYYDIHGNKVGSSSGSDNKTYYDSKGKYALESR